MEFDDVASAVAGVPNMDPAQGWAVYDHLRSTGARDVLEIGTAHGVSAAYMAAAVQANGGGSVTTVDGAEPTKHRDPAPGDVLERAGLADTVDRVLVDDSSYTWWLKQKVEERSDAQGNCSPLYDFCYLDGAHNWTIDGLSVILVEKLLKQDAWLLLDDLKWSYDASSSSFGQGQGPGDLGLSRSELAEPHVEAIFQLLVRQHPSFSQFRVVGDDWGWAQKRPDGSREVKIEEQAGLPMGSRLKAAARRIGSARS